MDTPGEGPVPQTSAASRDTIEYEPTGDEAELIRLSRRWMDLAQRPRDAAVQEALREIMAHDFKLQIWDGRRAPLTLDAWVKRGQGVGSQFGYDGLCAQVIGDIGVVYSRFWWSGSFQGNPFFDRGFLADLWRRSGRSWQIFSRRSAPTEQIRRLKERVP